MAAAAALLLAALTFACSDVNGNLVRMKLKVFFTVVQSADLSFFPPASLYFLERFVQKIYNFNYI